MIADYECVLVGLGREWNTLGEPDPANVRRAYDQLKQRLDGSDYFVVTVNYDDAAQDVFGDRCVSPCGSVSRYQCENGCETIFGDSPEDICPVCKGHMIPNNITAENYNENGYLGKWKEYTVWLERTLNRKLLILEFGTDFFAPSVIRFPFEKTCLYNKKANMVRVSRMYSMLPKELADTGRAKSICEDSIGYVMNDFDLDFNDDGGLE